MRYQSYGGVTSLRGRCNHEIVCSGMILLTGRRADWVDGDDEGDAHDDFVDKTVSLDAIQEEDTYYARPIQSRHRKYCPMHVKRLLVMCPSEQKLTMQLASWVENGR